MSRFNVLVSSWDKFSISAADDAHVNELKFTGVLLKLDTPSDKPPNGSRGHRIMISTEVAKKCMDTLVNMGVDYNDDDFDGHDPQKKVGVIKKVWIDGKNLMVEGVIWKKDFPDIEKVMKQGKLGMSFEGSEISVEDTDDPVWAITDICFTGAAILYRSKAAYTKTEALAASAIVMRAELIKKLSLDDGGKSMKKDANKKAKTRMSASEDTLTVKQVSAAFTTALQPLVKSVLASNALIAQSLASREEDEVEALEAAAKAEGAPGMVGSSTSTSSSSSVSSSSSEEEDVDGKGRGKKKVKAAKKKEKDPASSSSDDESDESDESDEEGAVRAGEVASDESDLEDVSDEDHAEDSKPGHANKFEKNKGDKTHVSDEHDKHKKVRGGVAASANRRLVKLTKVLLAEREETKKHIRRLEKKFKHTSAQVAAAADSTDRRSVANVSPRLAGLLSKNSVDIGTLSASGEKLAGSTFDAILDSVPSINARDRVALKTEAARAGILDEGIVNRN